MKIQRKAVHAIAQAGGLRAVGKYGAERIVEARPTGAAFELGLGGEQRQVAAGAGEDALAVLLQKRARPGTLGALVAQDLILLRCELGAPLGVGLFDLELLGGLGRRSLQPA